MFVIKVNNKFHSYELALYLFVFFHLISPVQFICAQTPLDEYDVYERIIERKDMDGYREGTPWDNSHLYINTVEYDGFSKGCFYARGCYGFMLDMMEYASNYEYPIRKIFASYNNIPEINIGDGIRVNNDTHSVFVIEKKSNSVVIVAEGNYDGQVHWGRSIDLSDPYEGLCYISTFWPELNTDLDDIEIDSNCRDISIYNLSGILLKNIRHTDLSILDIFIDLPQGTYIVNEGNKTYKLFNKGY